MNKKSVGTWPANAVHDIKEAKTMLQEAGYADADFTLMTHHKPLNMLKTQVMGLGFTYESWLLTHGIIDDVIMDNELPDDVVLLYASNKNFPFTHRYENPGWIIRDDSVVMITRVMSWDDSELGENNDT